MNLSANCQRKETITVRYQNELNRFAGRDVQKPAGVGYDGEGRDEGERLPK